jgi:hypothetical protein
MIKILNVANNLSHKRANKIKIFYIFGYPKRIKDVDLSMYIYLNFQILSVYIIFCVAHNNKIASKICMFVDYIIGYTSRFMFRFS